MKPRFTTWLFCAWTTLLFLILIDARCRAQGLTWDGPRLAPADAAAVLKASAARSNLTDSPEPLPDGPIVVFASSRPGALTWLPMPAFYDLCLTCGHGRYTRQYSSTVLTRGVSRSYSRGRR